MQGNRTRRMLLAGVRQEVAVENRKRRAFILDILAEK